MGLALLQTTSYRQDSQICSGTFGVVKDVLSNSCPMLLSNVHHKNEHTVYNAFVLCQVK